MPGLIGKKIGMTRIFSEEGSQIPVTVMKRSCLCSGKIGK
ncbi:MAG: hypothetical protein Ct9H300mP15_26790 [Gemmatimonadota bacterium]|nr:MAG: hypothetical protein Ct9H300mP15_26790 [Gemmatimonadota bacterium]